ncbi:hypothetical protein [Streptomyces lydicus]|uniref:hypothetical protein n=1 Tax=Streptomyces lydicus TaxID=47763 RepID=UPI00240E50AB|nr:hypothetical protein [Streptomyces lydicus]
MLLWASAFIVIRNAAAHFGPGALALGRLSWLFPGEVPGLLTLCGGLLCLSGVAVTRMRGRAPSPAPEAAPRSRAAGQPVAPVDSER